jgi:hypothetical protein
VFDPGGWMPVWQILIGLAALWPAS